VSTTGPAREAAVAFRDARQVSGAGRTRNSIARALRATTPFTLTCQTLAAGPACKNYFD